MPIYEFRCQECSKVSEFQLKIADPHPQTCPACGRDGLKKIMSLPSFQLKGGGWYSDSYDGRSNKKSNASSGSSSEASSSPASSGSEASSASSSSATPAATPAPAAKDKA